MSWDRKLVSIECFVCSTYNFDSFLLWDVSVKASNIETMSIETRVVSFATLVFSIKFKKSVVSLRYDFCVLAIG